MAYNNGMQFSTLDSDNDDWSKDCVNMYDGRGGWWYKACSYCTPNGFNYEENPAPTWQGIVWRDFNTGSTDRSLKSVTMSIRPSNV